MYQHLEKSITSLLVVAVSQTDTPIIMCSHQLLNGSIAPGIDTWCLLMPTDYVPSQEAIWRWWRLTTNGSSSSMDARLINGTVTHNLCLNFDSVCATHTHHIRSLNHTSQLSLAAVCFHRIGFWFRWRLGEGGLKYSNSRIGEDYNFCCSIHWGESACDSNKTNYT